MSRDYVTDALTEARDSLTRVILAWRVGYPASHVLGRLDTVEIEIGKVKERLAQHIGD